ncbi:FUSC family protein [Streptomyces sp. NBC_00670]|uniref:FUSC family protein n=1 Tax=Streptomyces sp. NBC_00670 TaxID=2975804 RepID=UPI002E362E87|nr:FUSC family protein [Streptomyces sp. NBC_00670]
MPSAAPRPHAKPPRIRRLPLLAVLRLGGPSDIWFKPALSSVASVAPPTLALLAVGRLDLAMYTMAGGLCALYAHSRPYAARARVLARVVAGMLAGLALALVAASLTTNPLVLVLVGALIAAVQKTLCDATRIGPPGHVVLTFIASAALFVPQSLGQVPGHLALTAVAGAWAWLVGMAPGLLRPHGPERRTTAQALRATAAYAATGGTGEGAGRAHATAAAAVQTAWQSLLPPTRSTATRRALRRLLVRAEVALAAPADTDPGRLRDWARALRGTGPVPDAGGLGEAAEELLGVEAEAEAAHEAPARPLRDGWSHLAPIALRTALGCALAGAAALALGVGRPYWALVTAASLYQANVTLTWSRAVQRVVGNVLGVLLFAAIVPLAHLAPVALVLCCLAFNFAAEAFMGRNYWLGTVCVTPMALLVTEFARFQQPGELIADRVLDTLVGALVGFVAAVAVTNRRAGDRVEQAVGTVERAREHAARTMAAERPAPGALESARRALAAAVVELRAAADAAAGEWWQRALPEERVLAAEQSAHRTLAATVRRQGLHTPHTSEDTRA